MAPALTTTEAFLQSFIHRRYIVLRRELVPFCLRHWTLLAALKSPLTHGGPWTVEDIRLAVLVLSTKSNDEFFAASRFRSFYWRIWKRFSSHVDVIHARAVIYEYIDDYLPSFPFWNSAQGEGHKVPGFFVAAARMLDSCTPHQVLNMPLGEIVAWNLARNETEPVMEPNANLMTDEHVEILRRPEFQEAA